ncbi:ubiquinone anaerobic biosynthesis accessory factor UbiT [Uliginosibacterium aquaticum]|uniref:Ubiquinone biosynthesis accessory factor UbiT n=1 Tax=Uliginosibacterium aquaticum TaxID=2731212 RepID=A0ABX2II85_9RHOO|nr:SCP2 sterol-binding domain-containing protein [Uliginosibacterium aquaticum]NSL56450.1 SCP2 sterol-binding domain-containing protein [Uliginosibacterium aquaticum]
MLPTDFRLPKFLSEIGPKLPQRPWSDALCASLELARFTKQLEADFSFLEGRTLRIVIEDLGARATLRYVNGHFRPAAGDADADVSFRAATADYLKLLRRTEDPDTLFFQRKLRIEGDTELGLTLKNLLDSIEPPAWFSKLVA